MAKYGSRMRMCERIPQALRLDMGDWMYTAVVRSTAERDAFIPVRAGTGVTKKASPSGKAFYLYKAGA